MLVTNEPAAAWISADAIIGQWRSTKVSYSANITAEGWTLSDLNAGNKYAVDVVMPYPSDVVFHPVVTDSSQIPAETQKLESAFLGSEGFGVLVEWRQYVW